MEIKYTLATNSYEFVTYLGGDAYSAPAFIKSDGTTKNIFYLHRDNQSSILAVSNAAGTVIERRLFDAWGQLAKFEKNGVEVAISSLNASNGIFLDRGYTGHEHLLGVGLINMNARLYDPKLRRFLQTDNEVQDPTDAQNYNRYGYCLNNPFKFTDPSGNNPLLIVAIAAIAYVGKSLVFNEHINAIGLITYSLTAGFTAALTFGLSPTVGTIMNFNLKTAIQTIIDPFASKLMSPMSLYKSKEFNLSISMMIGYGSSGFNLGANIDFSGQIGDFVYSGGYGFGMNSGMSSLGESAGRSNFSNWNPFMGVNDGYYTYGAGFSMNYFDGKTDQKVGALDFQVGQFGLRIDEDFFGDRGDRSRTGGVLVNYQVSNDVSLAFGFSMITGQAISDNADNLSYNSRDIRPTYINEINPNLRGGIFYGGYISNGKANFVGNNSEKRLHKIQNAIHDTERFNTPYFPNRNLEKRGYNYSGSYNSRYLFY